MKKVFGILAVLALFALLFTVGGMEQNTIDLGSGFIRSIVCIALFILFSGLAGAFYYDEENKEAAARSYDSHDGKRKAHTQYNTVSSDSQDERSTLCRKS